MAEPRDLNPFDEEGAPYYRIDPEDPAVESSGLTLYGADAPGYRRTSIAQFWRDWFDTDGMTLESTRAERVHVGWRIMRVQAALRGVLSHPRQFIGDGMAMAWFEPFHFFGAVSGDVTVRHICQAHQLPLLPPDVPAAHVNGVVAKSYDPDQDEALCAYVRLIEHISRRLGIARTRDGRMGLAGLTNPRMIRAAMPLPSEIIDHERRIVNGALDKLLEENVAEMRSWLRLEHELTDVEIETLTPLVRRYARDRSGIDDHMDSLALDYLRMEKIHEKQVANEDFRGAVQTIRDKQRLILAAKAGVRDDGEEDFGDIVDAEIAREEKKKALPAPESGGMIEDEDLP